MILELLLGRPALLVTIAVAIQFGLICLWSWRRSTVTARTVRVGFAAIPMLLTLNLLVTTARERIVAVCHELAEAVEDGDVNAIARHLDESFETAGLDRDAFLQTVNRALTRNRVDNVQLRRFEVAFPCDEVATAEFDASCSVRSSEVFFDRLLSGWRLRLAKKSETWLVTEIEALPRPFSPIKNLRDVLE